MFDLTTLDYIYIAIVLSSTVWATIRGGVYETVATFSWILAAVVARVVSPMLDNVFQQWFELSESTVGTLVSSYFIVFFVILVIFGLINQRLRDRIQQSMMKVTDHTLGVIFGIIRGIIMMGIIYWGMLWYYSDAATLPDFISTSRTRPVMQLTAVKIQEWFIPGTNKLLERDMTGTQESIEIYNNLINPAVKSEKEEMKIDLENNGPNENPPVAEPETGYKSSERTALENQLLQIENAAKAEDKIKNLEL
ncbi:MAG: CvpA family protein [Alphaproteobacteria bacterium]|nr:CvpA family protein [Alphaproteobacteria bacterium]MBN2675459.1 CvpA family protein [Alphaproteobacteria bacterium]